MNHRVAAVAVVVAFGTVAAACTRESPPSADTSPAAGNPAVSANEQWLVNGPNDERFVRIARHLRGFDVAMVETGYRYGELYWAGQDGNWDHAKYQVDKIRLAVRNGLERRPRRAASAQMLENALPGIDEAIAAMDATLFAERFAVLTETCNACHAAEQVAFFHVRPPAARTSSIGPPPPHGEVR